MNKGKMGIIISLCVLLTVPVALGGCSGDKASDSSQIIVGIAQDIEDSLDPHKVVAAGTREVLFNVYEGLLKPDTDGNIIPAVAESYGISEDGLTYTFKLRSSVKFHNGNAVTAEDVKYSIEKSAGMLDGSDPSIAAFSFIKEVNITGDDTVDIILSQKDVDFPAYLAMTAAAIIPEDNEDPDNNAIGTGPYKFVSRSPQENVIMERFDDYWGDKPEIKDVTFKVEANADAIVMDLKGGSIDMFPRLTTSQVEQLGEGFNVYEGSMNLVQALYLNNAVKPFDDVRVRRALCYAIDVQEILDLTSDGKGTPIGSSMYPSFKKYYLEELADAYPYDPDKAKELLKEAGYENGFEFSITVPSNYTPHVDTAQVIVQQLERVGVKAGIDLVEWNSWLSDVYSARNYESTVIGVDASYMTARALLERFNSEADNNFVNFSDPEYDKLYQIAVSSTDDKESTDAYKDMERILSDRAANVYIQDMAEFVAISDKYTGYEFYPMYIQDIAKLKLAK